MANVLHYYNVCCIDIAIRFSDTDYFANESSEEMIVDLELIRGTSAEPVNFRVTFTGETATG